MWLRNHIGKEIDDAVQFIAQVIEPRWKTSGLGMPDCSPFQAAKLRHDPEELQVHLKWLQKGANKYFAGYKEWRHRIISARINRCLIYPISIIVEGYGIKFGDPAEMMMFIVGHELQHFLLDTHQVDCKYVCGKCTDNASAKSTRSGPGNSKCYRSKRGHRACEVQCDEAGVKILMEFREWRKQR